MRKRIIALLLALILTVGLLPTVALATEGDTPVAGTSSDVKNGYYEGTTWKEGTLNQGTLPTGVESVSKTAKKVEGKENEYEVKLEVVLKQTEENSGKAATVLVLDTSGSMAYCAECGAEGDCVHNYVKFNGTPNSSTKYYYETKDEKVERAYYCDGNHEILTGLKHPAGWFTTSGDDFLYHDPKTDSLAGQTIYVKSATPRASRLDAAKVAAENFLKTYSGLKFNTDGTPAANQNNRNLGRYVSVVSFATKAESVQSWVDVSNSDVYKEVLKNIKRLNANGGTNLDAGLTYAEYLLKKTTVNDAVKNVIALTDGQPTFFIDTYEKAYDDDGLKGIYKEFLKIGNTEYRVHGTGNSCNAKTFTETVASAVAVKNHAKLYTVCFDANETIDVPNSENQISVSEYLSTKIATQPTKTGEQFAYDASNAEQLYAEFAKITQSIVSGLNTGTVKDTLPTGITSAAFDEGNVKEWKLNEAPFTKNETPNTVGGKQVTTYTYTYTYTVTIDPLTVAKTEIDGAYYAPLNGKTTLTVKNSQGTDVEIPFPIPAGKVTMPSYTVTWKSQDGSTLETDNDVEYNTKPTFNSDAPTKADDAQYTYTFVGWATEANRETGTPEANLPAVTDDVTYYAAFSKTPRTYTVTWMPQDGQGNAYETDTGVAYNARPSYDGTEPTKAADAEHTYTFVGWATTPNQTSGSAVANLPNVTEDVTYYAAFSATPRTYTVTYTDGVNGTAFAVQTTSNVAYSAPIPAFNGDTPTREGYNFNGWTSNVEGVTLSSTMPASDVTFTAQWKEKDKVTIKYVAKDGGTVTLANETLNPDTGTAAGSTATANTGYRFVGWYDNSECTGTALSKDASYTPLKPEAGWADKTYYAKFESLTYTITFKTENGGTINDQTNDITHPGLTAGTTFPAVPTTKANTGYYFLGWYDESGNKVEENAFPEKVTGNATYTAKWLSYKSVNLDLTGKIQKTLNSDVALTNEIFTINLTLNGAEVPSATATATVSPALDNGSYTDTKPFVAASDNFKLAFTAPGIYNYSIVEEDGQLAGMTYDVNKPTDGHKLTVNVTADDTTHALSFESVTVDGTSIADVTVATTWLTITNTYTEPKEPRVVSKTVVTTDMVDTLPPSVSSDIEAFKNKVDILYPVVNGEASTLEVPYGTKSVTLLYKITVNAGTKTSMQFEDVGAERVSVFDDDNVDVSQAGRTFTVRFYRGVTTADIYVAKTYKNLVFDSNGECTVENVISEEIKATTTVTEKDPNKLTINFADYVQKELAATGTKTASDVDFTVDVKGKEQTMIITSAEGEEAISTYADEFDPKYSRTLTAHFDSITGGEVKTTRFTGTTVEIDHAGHYTFFLGEEKGTRTGVTYDEARYTLYINVRLDQNENKLYVSSMGAIRTNSDGTWENIALIEMVNDEPVRTTNYITFHNTIDTGKDDYYPIIIPTIINKDTGMLNKTDHFAYVIGYPDGTVHPNGQITRAEVATIFFRLLRAEVRDGAFTTSNSYSDVAYGKWYNNPISTMSALGIITGYPDGTFKPNKPITRAEFAAIAARFDETQSGKSATFSDVIGHWAAKEIGIAYYNDWIKGYPDGTFKPDQNITRAEAMTLINRVLERKPESPADLLTNMNKWTDNMDTSKWYYLDVQEATNSHGYTRKTFNYELWRQMLPDPDWSRYER